MSQADNYATQPPLAPPRQTTVAPVVACDDGNTLIDENPTLATTAVPQSPQQITPLQHQYIPPEALTQPLNNALNEITVGQKRPAVEDLLAVGHPPPTKKAPFPPRRQYSRALKASVLSFLLQNKDAKFTDVARRFEVSESALRDWRRAWEHEGHVFETCSAGAAMKSAEPETRTTTKRKRYTNELKVQILSFLRAHQASLSYEAVAKRFDVSVSALRDWRKNEASILQCHNEKRGEKKANPKYPLKRITDAVIMYWDNNNTLPVDQQIRITMVAVRDNALQIKQRFLQDHQAQPFLNEAEYKALMSFNASNTWCARILKRVKQETASLDQLQKIVKLYRPRECWLLTPVLLLYRALPSNTNLSSQHSHASDHISLYLCANEEGTKMVPTLVGPQPPGPEIPGHSTMPYLFQTNGLSDQFTLQKWWQQVFLPQIRQRGTEPVVLFVLSQTPELVDPKNQVRVVQIPGTHQPKLLSSFKKFYRYNLLLEIFSTFQDRTTRRKIANAANLPQGSRGICEGHPPHISDVTRLVKISWESVTTSFIKHCWHKTELRVNNKKLDDSSFKLMEQTSDGMLKEIMSLLGKAQPNKELEGLDFERDVMETYELLNGKSHQDLAHVLGEWIGLEGTDKVKQHLEQEANALLDADLDTILGELPGEAGGGRGIGAGTREWTQNLEYPASVGPATAAPLGPAEIEDCATGIMTIASRLLNSDQPGYQAIASELLKVPDQLLKARRIQERGHSDNDNTLYE